MIERRRQRTAGTVLCLFSPDTYRYPLYAQILQSANPGKSPRELLPAMMEELEDRGMGYVSSEYALDVLRRVK